MGNSCKDKKLVDLQEYNAAVWWKYLVIKICFGPSINSLLSVQRLWWVSFGMVVFFTLDLRVVKV